MVMLTLAKVLIFVVLLFSVILHEVAHGYTALRLGDPTARDAGRLTLNPIKHIDPFGTVVLPLLLHLAQSPILIGWASPPSERAT
jgi:Zn-dependent protease